MQNLNHKFNKGQHVRWKAVEIPDTESITGTIVCVRDSNGTLYDVQYDKPDYNAPNYSFFFLAREFELELYDNTNQN
jgi:hypothetical protein